MVTQTYIDYFHDYCHNNFLSAIFIAIFTIVIIVVSIVALFVVAIIVLSIILFVVVLSYVSLSVVLCTYRDILAPIFIPHKQRWIAIVVLSFFYINQLILKHFSFKTTI